MSLLRRVTTFLTPTQSSANLNAGFSTAKTEADLFPPTDPAIDGEQCLHDCSSCTVHYPAKFSIDEDDRLFGHVKGFNVHLLVGTGKTDWVRDVTDEKHSVMQAVGKVGLEMSGKRGKVMLSASNFPSGEECHGPGEEEGTADVMLLPSWKLIEKVPPSKAGALMREVVERSSTNDTPVGGTRLELNGTPNGHTEAPTAEQERVQQDAEQRQEAEKEQEGTPDLSSLHIGGESTLDPAPIPPSISTSFKTRPIPHSYLILMCSQKTRDARCGQSAPLLRKEFERILRPLGLYRDVHDDRPGGVGIYFISHVGGHKYSANVMIYRRQGQKRDGKDADGQKLEDEAVQLIWLARVRPEDCENIVRYTVLQGKVVKPKSQLRGGFDREKGVASW
ncbi:hypothetical protein G647_08373 [Cladophialophora carrionii CBS 160.54]|uniref:Uncharacterized protein n=1 Tax=Cladophialophora carrionii CBS 160.54 TaxID=1279043 RepID=V9D0A3_9EURO|nr:uncharacterized protein G647_08373 [Cladophialophora carrionii CBS 160.54]ETI20339.1 hypothetical protein G647_08373 [Cladophialophora carrionii CBS 160.54]